MLPDTTVGPYRVVRSLGHGGMGEVALAYDDRLRRHVALKSLLDDSGRDGRTALIDEARAAAALSHPGIASIFDIIEQEDRAYIVMEYVEGETLAARLREGPLRRREAIEIARQLCSALDSAHDQDVIHRDLKPGNIMLGKDGRAKILDFGIAKHIVTATATATTQAASTVGHSSIAGTVGYMAPEQAIGQPIDRRTDIFSLGAVLFEMFTGRRPFLERDGMAYAAKVTSTDAPRATDVNASVGDAIASVIAKAMARHPRDRFDRAGDVVAALDSAVADQPSIHSIDTTTAAWTQRYSSPRNIALLTGALLIAVASALSLIGYPRVRMFADPSAPPSVLAISPVAAFDVDETTQALAAGVTTLLTANLAAVPGLNAVPATSPAATKTATPSRAAQLAGAAWVLQTSLRSANGALAAEMILRKVGDDNPAWQTRFEGDALTIVRRSLLAVADGIVDADLLGRLDDRTRARLTSVGTNDSTAFLQYARGRQLLAGVSSVDVLSKALAHFESSVDKDPRFALAWAGLSESLRRRYQQTQVADDSSRAIDAANRAATIDPDLAAVQLSLASTFNLTGRTADALAAIDRAITLQPASDEAYRLRGTSLIQAGRQDEGIAALQHAIALRPSFYVNYELLGFWLFRMGRNQDAVDAYRRVTELAPDYAAGYQGLGTALHRLGHVDEAVGNYEHAVRLGPSATAYSNLAYSYYESGRFRDALAAYQESITRDPSRPAVHRNIGDVLTRLGQLAEARAAYAAGIDAANALLKVNANDAPTIVMQALCEAKLGRTLMAERHAAEALSLAPKNMEVAVRNAEVYAILRQPSRSVAHLRSAIQLGYDRASLISNDELKTLADVPEFKQLALELQTKRE